MLGVSAIAIRLAVSCLAWRCRRRKLCLDDILRVFRGMDGSGLRRTNEDTIEGGGRAGLFGISIHERFMVNSKNNSSSRLPSQKIKTGDKEDYLT
jgi:hypothetical protein